MSKVTESFVYTSLAIILGAVAIVSYWLAWPYEPYSGPYSDQLLLVGETRIFHAGDKVTYRIVGTHNTTGMYAMVSTQLVDGIVIQYPARAYLTKAGPHDFTITHELPEFLDPGKYSIQSFTAIQVNPLRAITLRRATDEFLVVP